MIPAIVTSTLTSIAKDVLKDWGLGQVDDLANKLFHIHLKTDAKVEQTNEQLKQITAQLTTINNNITNLSTTMTEEFLGVKVDTVEAYVGIISNLYQEYITTLKAVGSDAWNQNPQQNRQHFKTVGDAIQDKVFPALSQIHTFLANQEDRSLFAKAIKQSCLNHADLITHYRAMRAMFTTYLAHQAKGIFLIQAVQQDPQVTLANHNEMLKSALENIESQEIRFTNWFGRRCETLARRLLLEPDNEIPITICAGPNDLALNFANFSPVILNIADADGDYVQWYMKCWADLKRASERTDHTFKIRCWTPSGGNTADLGTWLGQVPNHADDRAVIGHGDNGWRLCPVAKDRVQLQRVHSKDGDRTLAWGYPECGVVRDRKSEDIHQQFSIFPTRELGVGSTLGYEWDGKKVLGAGHHRLKPGIPLVSSNGKWRFEMMPETGHLRLAELPELKNVVWQFTKKDQPEIAPGEIKFQVDGNLVAYKKENVQDAASSFWSSATNMGIAERGWVVVTDDGHLDIRVAQAEGEGFKVVKRLP